MLRNFPIRWLAALMRVFIFPRGLTYFAPADRLARRVADLVQNDNDCRTRLGRAIYVTPDPGNPLGQLQQALKLAPVAESLEKRIRVEGVKTGRIHALDLPDQITEALQLGLINPEEAAYLRDYDRRVMDIINVDDFESHELGLNR